MYIESRFYDNGTAKARMHHTRPAMKTSEKYDTYLDEYNTLQEWLDDLKGVETDDITTLASDLEASKWVDISSYC